MAFGILEPRQRKDVPGTVELDEGATESHGLSNLKHGTGKFSKIVLSPQPSDDVNDPLNWSLNEKRLVMGIIVFGTLINAALPVNHPIKMFPISDHANTPPLGTPAQRWLRPNRYRVERLPHGYRKDLWILSSSHWSYWASRLSSR